MLSTYNSNLSFQFVPMLHYCKVIVHTIKTHFYYHGKRALADRMMLLFIFHVASRSQGKEKPLSRFIPRLLLRSFIIRTTCLSICLLANTITADQFSTPSRSDHARVKVKSFVSFISIYHNNVACTARELASFSVTFWNMLQHIVGLNQFCQILMLLC